MCTPSLSLLRTELAQCRQIIGYTVLADEVDPASLLPPQAVDLVRISADKTSDPFAWAARYASAYGDGRAAILVPGRLFDAHGTRHGRGGGWYDRFLSATPSRWLRIGITAPSQFSTSPLARQPCDMPMDWVAVRSDTGWEAHRTQARGR
jgi:hypothetical protein